MKKFFTLLIGLMLLASAHINAQLFKLDNVSSIKKSSSLKTSTQKGSDIVHSANLNAEKSDRTLFFEDFESVTNEPPYSLPEGWTTIATPGYAEDIWRAGTLQFGSSPFSGASGSKYAFILTNAETAHDSWAFAPGIVLEANTDYIISFSVYMKGDQAKENLEVKLGTSTNVADMTTVLYTKNANVTSWTNVKYIFTPTTAGTYYVGFHSISPVLGNATLIDDVKVDKGGPLFNGVSTLDFGRVLDLDALKQATYTVTNKGTRDLIVNLSSASPEITIPGLPITVAPNKSTKITVNLNKKELGDYSGSFTLSTNDEFTPSINVSVKATVDEARVTDYNFEDFELGKPVDWKFNQFDLLSNGKGINNSSRCARIWTMLYPNSLTTHYVKMGTTPVLKFNYKAEEYKVTYDGAPSKPQDVSFHVLVSNDFGATFTQVYHIGPNGNQAHVVSYDYAEISLDLSAYANDTCLIRFTTDQGSFFTSASIYFDNISLGTKYVNDLAALELKGNAIPDIYSENTYTVSVKNNGSAIQSDYTVKLMKEGGVEVASQQGVSINENEIKTFNFNWTPTVEESTNLYAQVVLSGDENDANNQTNNLSVTVQPLNLTVITIGTLTDTLIGLPVNFYSKNSFAQTLYHANEVGTNGGMITSLQYQVNTSTTFQTGVIKIWIGETSKIDFDDGEWINPSELTLVFENSMTIPEGTNVDVTIPFSTPFAYHGGNLVVYAVRQADDYFLNKSFFGSARNSRSLYNGTDQGGVTPENPGTGQLRNWIPITTLTITNHEKGSIAGVVSYNSADLEGVRVRVLGTQLYSITDSRGEYSFPSLVPGTYSLEFSKHGYITKTVNEIVLGANTVETVNITMDKIPEYTVAGTISASESGTGIKGALVRLTGYDNYRALTDAAGNYIITDVYGGSGFEYDVTVSAPYYESQTGKVTVDGNISGLDFALSEIPYPVHSISATVISGENPTITWKEPMPEFRYDNGINTGYLGYSTGDSKSVIGSVHRNHAKINEISWFTTSDQGPHLKVNLFIFDLDEEGNPIPNILYTISDVPNVDMQWNTYVLANPVEAPNGFMVAISTNSGNMGLGITDPDSDYPLSKGIHYSSSNYTLINPNTGLYFTDLSYSYSNHPMIRALGEDMGEIDYNNYVKTAAFKSELTTFGETPTFTSKEKSIDAGFPIYKTAKNISAKTLSNYTIYRLREGQPQSEWALIANNVSSLTVTDSNWGKLDAGVYKYAVVANYTNTSSEPRFSNSLSKGMEFEYTINLVTGSANTTNGAVVKLINQNFTSEYYVYSATANGNTAVFPNVYIGSYKLSVTLPGYEPFIQDVQIEGVGSFDANLVEIKVKPFGLKIDNTESSSEALFQWGHNLFFDNIEGYDGFSINNIGDYSLIDGDGLVTTGVSEVSYPNKNFKGSFMVFNPYSTNPSMTVIDYYRNVSEPYSGNKYLSCPSAKGGNGNNDWLILPKTEILDGMVFKFMAKSIVSHYSLDRIKIGVSETGSNQTDFTFIQQGEYIEVPSEWTEYSFDLSEYAGKEIYIAINCVSNGTSFMLMLDDIFCGMNDFYGAGDASSSGYNIYLNGTEVATNVQTTEYNFSGLKDGNYTAGVRAVYGSGLSEMATIDFTVVNTGIDDSDATNLYLFPNPFSDKIFISDPSQVKRIKFVNVIGTVVKEIIPNGNSISTSDLPKGVYMISIEFNTGYRIVRKLIKE